MNSNGFDQIRLNIKDIYSAPLLTLEEETELGLRALDGDMEARHELVRRNLRLVLKVVGRFLPYAPEHFDDLFSEGADGLFRATRDWDPSRSKFSTQAFRWARQRMGRYCIEKFPTVRIPSHLYKLRAKVRRGAELTEEEIGWWDRYGRYATAETFLFDSVPNDRLDRVVARIPEDPDLSEDDVKLSGIIARRLERQTPRNRSIIRSRHEEGRTLKEVGDLFGISRERVRQIEKRFFEDVRRWAKIAEKHEHIERAAS